MILGCVFLICNWLGLRNFNLNFDHGNTCHKLAMPMWRSLKFEYVPIMVEAEVIVCILF